LGPIARIILEVDINSSIKLCLAKIALNQPQLALAVWLSGNAWASINVVALRQTRLVPGCMHDRLGM